MNLPPFSSFSVELGEKEKSEDLLQLLSVTEKLRNSVLQKSKQKTYLSFQRREAHPDSTVAFRQDG